MRYPTLPTCTFRETFESANSVIQNGGVVVGNSANGKFVGNGTTSNYVHYPKGPQIWGKTWSVRIKFKLNALDAVFTALYAKDFAGARAFVLGLTNAGNPYFELYPTGSGPAGTTPISTGAVVDMVYTQDGLNTRCFVNGVQNGTTGTAGQIPFVSGSTSIGRRMYTSNERSLNGEIYLVEVYQGYALSAEECLDLYQQDTVQEVDLSQAIINANFRSSLVDGSGNTVIKNLGMLGGEFTLGDGTTAAKMPTLSSAHKATFTATSNQYVGTRQRLASYIEYNKPFTVFAIARTDGGLYRALFGNLSPGNLGLIIFSHDANLFISLRGVGGTLESSTLSGTVPKGVVTSLCVTYSGVTGPTAIKAYAALKDISAGAGGAVTGTIQNGLDFRIGSMYGSQDLQCWEKDMYYFLVFPFAISQLQYKWLHNQLMKTINV